MEVARFALTSETWYLFVLDLSNFDSRHISYICPIYVKYKELLLVK